MLIAFDLTERGTIAARKLDMVRAGEAVVGATLTVEDDRRIYGEDCLITIGFFDSRMVVLVWMSWGGVH